MKTPKINIKTNFWNKETKDFQEAIINLIWFILIVCCITLGMNIFNQTIAGMGMIGITIIILIIIIISYNKNKRTKK